MSHFTIYLLIASLVFLVLISAFFSSAETGLMALNRYRLRHMAREGNKVAKLILDLLKRPDRLLGVILIGNTCANIIASSIATIIGMEFFGEFGVVIATVLLTFVILIFAEIAPKTVAATYPQALAFFCAWPLSLILKLLYPLVWSANFIANNFLKLFGFKYHEHATESLSTEELRSVVSEASGKIPPSHQEMLTRILDLEKATIEDIMIPRSEILGIDLEDDSEDIKYQLQTAQHTRLPIYRENINNVLGIIHIRSAIELLSHKHFDKNKLLTLSDKIYFIPENTPLHTQLLNFKKAKRRSAFVVDEYGDIKGLVTLEDILEEIIGEFTTSYADTSKDIHPQEDGSYLVDGSITLRELNRSLNWDFPLDGPKTLNGLIIEYLESIPQANMCIRIGDYAIEIILISDNIVKTAKINKLL